MQLNRRTLLKLAGLSPAAHLVGVEIALGQDRVFSHAASMYGDVKYPADYKHFDYVNPNAPKGGKLRLAVLGSFDSLNPYTIKADSIGAEGVETLLTNSLDEPFTEYGLLAEGIWYPEDRSSAVFRLRPEAKFHDGKSISVEDVIWSFEIQRANLPSISAYYADVERAEQTGENEVTFVFKVKNNRELPLIMGQLSVLPKHWWTGKDANGKQRDINASTLELPLGSGPYKLVDAKPGQSYRLKRVEDYWGKDLPVNVGKNNFDEIETFLFKDQTVLFEAFKGDQYDYNLESTARIWATGYDFPAVKDGRVIKEEITLETTKPIQVWALNLRRAKFQDERVRRAFNLAFDFEWSNQNLFYSQYVRARSIFNNSEMEAKGLPSPEELVLLEPLRADLPAAVFTQEYSNPVNTNAQERRKNLREASKLLAEAGWNVTQAGGRNVLKNSAGETLSAEFLLYSPAFERIALPYEQQLELLGIDVSIRTIDLAQYERRTENFEYDIIVGGWGQSLSPGNEQREYWGTASADKPGSRNSAGIKNKAIDALIEKVVLAQDRQSLVTACRALDRAVMHNNYFVPMYYGKTERIARWDRFGKPDKLPAYAIGFPLIWWWDDEKAKKTRA
jgi:microcin C transport system substrate-binding protein